MTGEALPRLGALLPERGTAARLRVLLRPVVLFLAARVAGLLAMGAAIAGQPYLPMRVAMFRWDGSWYLRIADDGYADHLTRSADGHVLASTHAFFPLLGALGRAVHLVTRVGTKPSLVIVAYGSGLAATTLIWLLVRALADGAAADRATALYCVFPGAFAWTLVYSEPLMVALAAGSLIAALQRRWWLAGALALLATATRANALALVPALAWAAFVAVRDRREWRAIVAPALAPLGMLAFLVFLGRRTGDYAAWQHANRGGWNQHIDLGRAMWTRTVHAFQQAPLGDRHDLGAVASTLGIAAVGVGIWALRRWRPPALLLIYTAGVLLLAVASSAVGLRPRELETAFPLVVAIGIAIRGMTARVVLCLSLAGMLALTVVTTVSNTALVP